MRLGENIHSASSIVPILLMRILKNSEGKWKGKEAA